VSDARPPLSDHGCIDLPPDRRYSLDREGQSPRRYVVTHIVKRSLLAVSALALAFGIFAAGSIPAAHAAATPATYQVRLVATPVDKTNPSFVAPLGNLLAWTGSYKGTAKMYVYDLVSGQNVYINPGPAGSYFNPAAEDKYVTFQGHTTGGYDDLYLYNTETKNLQIVSSLGLDGDQGDWNPRIQGGRVVWEKDTADPTAGSGIYLYDIASRDKHVILPGAQYRDPDIWGDYVVCVEDVASDAGPNASKIVLYNLTTAETTVIAPGDKDNEHPRIDGGKVVWSSGDVWTAGTAATWTTTYQIRLYDLGTSETTTITSDEAGNLNPSIGGDLVVWQTWTPSSVKGYSISSDQTFYVSSERGGDTAREPEVDGTRVAWWGSKGLYYAVPSGEAAKFPDVPTGHHYLTAIENAAAQNIMTGYGDGDFGPNDWLIHQQFAQMIDVTMGYTVTENDLYDFTDQPPIVHLATTLYPYHYVAVAALKGAVVTYADGTYRPLYRERGAEAVASAVRAGGEYVTQPPDDFTGTLSSEDPVTAGALRTAEYNGLLDNIVGSDGTLASWDPSAPITRAETAQLLWNLHGKVHPTT
jgi:hypothetical protein